MDRDYDVLFRIMILGDTGVGKTCLLQRFCDNEFRYSHVCTIGIDFKMKTLVMDNVRVRIQIWDTAGQERYRSITTQYFRKAQGIVVVYDVTDEKSFLNVRKWLADVKEFGDEEVSIILVANKSDREDSREIGTQSGKQLAEELDVPFFEASAYTNENVPELFTSITDLVLERFKGEVMESIKERNESSLSTSGSEDEDVGAVSDPKLKKESLTIEKKSGEDGCCHIL